jgi:hypothetical protein
MRITSFLLGAQRCLGALLVVGLVACAGPSTPPPATVAQAPGAAAQPTTAPLQSTAVVAPTVPAPTSTLKADTSADAEALAAAFSDLDKRVSEVLGVPVTAGGAIFSDFITGGDVSSYRLIAHGTGADLRNMGAIAEKIESVFGALGWEQDVTYGATGVGRSMIGYRQGSKLVVVTVAVEPSDDANCPKGTPITNCDLRPEQMLFTVTLASMLRE